MDVICIIFRQRIKKLPHPVMTILDLNESKNIQRASDLVHTPPFCCVLSAPGIFGILAPALL